MASNSEANLPSDFDIDEVINWDEHNYSSKDISFQIPPLGLPNDVKTPQNTTTSHSSLSSAIVSSQQATLSGTKTKNLSYASLLVSRSNPAPVVNSKSHGISSQQAMVSPGGPAFPSESLDIPPISLSSSRPSFLQFPSPLVSHTRTLASQIPAQPVRNTGNLLNNSVSPFADQAMEESGDIIEGPLDKIVNQIIEEQLNESIMKTSVSSDSYSQHPVVTFTNITGSQASSTTGNSVGNANNNITNSLTTIKRGGTQLVQKNISTPSTTQFLLQNPGHVSSSVAKDLSHVSMTDLFQSNQQQMTSTLDHDSDIEELFGIRESASSNVSDVGPSQFRNQKKDCKPSPTQPSLAKALTLGAGSAVGRPSNAKFVPGNKKPSPNARTVSPNSELSKTQNNIATKSPFVTTTSNNLISSASKLAPSATTSEVFDSPKMLGQQDVLPKNLTTSALGSQTSVVHRSSSPQGNSVVNVELPNITQQNFNLKRKLLQSSSSNTASNLIPDKGLNIQNALPQQGVSLPNLASGVVGSSSQGVGSSPGVASSNVASLLVAQQGMNIQRSVPQQGTGKPSSALDTASPSISRISNQPGISKVQMFPQNMNKNPASQSMTNLNNQGVISNSQVFSQIGMSQSQIPSTKFSLTNANSTSNTTSKVNNNFSIFTLANSFGDTKPQQVGQRLSVSEMSQLQTLTTKPVQSVGNSNPGLNQVNIFSTASVATTSNNALPQLHVNVLKQMAPDISQSSSPISTMQSSFSQNTVNTGVGQLSSNISTSSMSTTQNSFYPSLNTQKQTVPEVSHPSSTSISILPQQNLTVPAAKSISATTLKITSPSGNVAGSFKHPSSSPTVALSSPHFNQLSPRSSTANSFFPRMQVGQTSSLGMGSTASNSPRMVFTLAPGSQGAATLKALPISVKDKLSGRQVFLLQQPGQVISTTKQQPVKIIFVNDRSVRQLVSGPEKFKVTSSSSAVVSNQNSLLHTTSPTTSFTSTPAKSVKAPPSPVLEASEGSPGSVSSTESDTIPIAKLVQMEPQKPKPEKKNRGTKRRKDPNKPVKPLSSFQRFFQKTQVAIRQQVPEAPFDVVSKVAKEMWDNLAAKDKKVYQDAWRVERAQYKKALEEYNAGLEESKVEEPSPKQTKTGQSSTSPVPVSPIDVPDSGLGRLSATAASPSSGTTLTTSISPSRSAAALTSLSSMAAPHGTGKPLAMMAQLANKTKMASEQGSSKTTGSTKSSSLGKTKGSGNGPDAATTQITKKKPKINPIPRKTCIRENCNKAAKTTKERGTSFCSNDCVMLHCKGVFKMWVNARRASLKATS